MNENISKTLKSSETDDWLDFHIIRPLCFYFVRFFAWLGISPNAVTILSMFVGAASSYFFASGCLFYEGTKGLVYNLIAITLLMIADLLDCTDGQLARYTGQKSRMGRILDGVAGFIWFIPIYHVLVYRFYMHHSIEFGWLGIEDTQQNAIIATAAVYILGLISGVLGMGGQTRLADYYYQVHLFFLKGEKGSELDDSQRQKEIYEQMPADSNWMERAFQKSYIDYTRKQEKVTPQFQRLMALLRQKFGNAGNMPAEVRDELHSQSLSLMKWNGLLTFNFRSAWFFLFCLLDVPVMNFLFEIIVMGLLAYYINRRHEAFCKRVADQL